MYCPLGFVTAIELSTRLTAFGDARMTFIGMANYAAEVDGFTKAGGLNGQSLMNLLLMRQAFPEWAIWRILILQPFPTYICSPDGRVLRVSHPLFYGSNELDFEYFSVPDLSREQQSLIDVMESRNLQAMHEIPDRGWFVSGRHWTVRTQERALEKIQAWSRDLSDYPDAKAEFDAEMADFVQLIKPFQGWAICFSEDDIPIDNERMEAMLDSLGATFSLPSSKSSLPALRASTAEALAIVFPDGRRGTPWKVVAAMVQERLGRPVSQKTCMRAAAELGQAWTG